MKINQIPPHINNPREVLALVRKYNRNPNPFMAYRIAELLGYEPDTQISTEKTAMNPDIDVSNYF